MNPRPWHMVVADLAELYRYLDGKNLVIDPQHFLDAPETYEAEWKRYLREEEGIA